MDEPWTFFCSNEDHNKAMKKGEKQETEILLDFKIKLIN